MKRVRRWMLNFATVASLVMVFAAVAGWIITGAGYGNLRIAYGRSEPTIRWIRLDISLRQGQLVFGDTVIWNAMPANESIGWQIIPEFYAADKYALNQSILGGWRLLTRTWDFGSSAKRRTDI